MIAPTDRELSPPPLPNRTERDRQQTEYFLATMQAGAEKALATVDALPANTPHEWRVSTRMYWVHAIKAIKWCRHCNGAPVMEI